MNLKSTALFILACSMASLLQASELYKIDPEHTFVSFSYRHMNYSVQTSRFDVVNGIITLNDENNGGTMDVSIDMKSASTGSVIFNKLLQSDDFFAAERFPIATFQSDNILFSKGGVSAIDGSLSIKGITKPISIEVTSFSCGRNLLTFKYTCGANATAKLSRSDFDLGKYVPLVGDEVTLNIAIEASRE
jgi:polyisoprenoid-binding protein YceI